MRIVQTSISTSRLKNTTIAAAAHIVVLDVENQACK